MKKLITILLAAFTLTAAYADNTNSPTVLKQATATAKSAISTNLNEVIVDILRGVKTAGGEVYAASKTAITKSVDFTMEQAPLVVHEFLRWKVAEACMWIVIWVGVASLMFWFARQLKLYQAKSRYYEEECVGFKWFLRIVACLMIVIVVGVNGMKITKVVVAPVSI